MRKKDQQHGLHETLGTYLWKLWGGRDLQSQFKRGRQQKSITRDRPTHSWMWAIELIPFHEKATFIVSWDRECTSNVSTSWITWKKLFITDWAFMHCFRNVRSQGLWPGAGQGIQVLGPRFSPAFRYFLSAHSTPLKTEEILKIAELLLEVGLSCTCTFKVIFQFDFSFLFPSLSSDFSFSSSFIACSSPALFHTHSPYSQCY